MSIKTHKMYSDDGVNYGEYEIHNNTNIIFVNFIRYGSEQKTTLNNYDKAVEILDKTFKHVQNEGCQYILCKVISISGIKMFLEYFEKARVFNKEKELETTELKKEIDSLYSSETDFSCNTKQSLYTETLLFYIPLTKNAPIPFNFMELGETEYKGKGRKVIKITETKPDGDYIITNNFNVGDENKYNIYVSDKDIISIKKDVSQDESDITRTK